MSATMDRSISRRRFGDHWIYVFTTAVFVLTAVVGFGPRSAAILTGAMPTPALVVHLHAALMVTWLLLLVAQTSLAASGRLKLHQTLGVASFVLAPLLLGTLIATAVSAYGALTQIGQGDFASNVLLVQIRAAVMFPLFYIWAMATRRSAPEMHKRMILLATLVVVDAAIGRMPWLPGNDAQVSYDMAHVYQLLLLVPALVFDLVRFGRIHRAYVVGLGLLLPWIIATSFLWSSPWWLRTVPALMGVSG